MFKKRHAMSFFVIKQFFCYKKEFFFVIKPGYTLKIILVDYLISLKYEHLVYRKGVRASFQLPINF